MGTLLEALKTLKVWQIGVLAAILLGVAGATYGVYAMAGSSDRTDVSKNQQLIPVVYGNVVNQVSTNGSLVFANRATLTFGTQGTVGEVLVGEGQQVKEGQPLAKLDAATAASLEKAVAQARVNLKNAQDVLATAKAPWTPLDLALAESKVADARLALKSAQDALDNVKNGPTDDDLTKAQAQLDSAKVSLSNSEKDLALGRKEWDAKIKVVGDALATAKEGYPKIFSKWLGIQIGQDQADLAPDTILASWKVELNALFDPSLRFLDTSKGWFSGGPPSDDPSTPWNEPIVYTWLNLYPGQLLATCPSGDVQPQGTCVKKEMDGAWDAYQKAKDSLEAIQVQASRAIATADTVVTRAKDSLATAEEALADLKAGPDPLLVDSNEKQLAVAKASLAKAEDDLANLKANIPLNIALKEAEVAAAQAALDTAVQRLDGATLKAPMAGVVSLVNVDVGQTVNATFTIVEVVDSNTVELNGIVDQTDVLFVRVGAQANVTMDALRGQVLQGTVSSIASAAQTQQGIVSYPITIRLQVPQGLQLREGLSATASIVIREENNVLLVPLQALYGTFDQPVVKVMNNGRTEERPVVLGNSDDYWVAVRQGLAQGDQVVMQAQQATAGQLNVGQAFRQLQGQFGQGTFQSGGGPQQGGGGTQRAQPTPRATPRPSR